ncbi:F-box protein PP2-A13 [Euphorbia peplus]|nr:F-box protein PP2-A13 [Euphorbia peplus]
MGANVSSSSSVLHCTDGGDIPENCVSSILMHLDPVEICKFATLNRAFHGASSADFIWESKMPFNYRFMLDNLLDDKQLSMPNSGKKDLYSRLSQPNSFHAGTKEFWLDKKSGGVCLFISSKALNITGINDRRYWNHIPVEELRLGTAAYLQQIWWVEVDGELEFKFPKGTYSLFFRLQLGRPSKRMGRRVCNTGHIHGWDLKPVRFELITWDGQQAVSQCFLNDDPGNWVSYHVGDFVVENTNVVTKIKFSFTQIDCTHTKGGLCLDGVYILPNTCNLAREMCRNFEVARGL